MLALWQRVAKFEPPKPKAKVRPAFKSLFTKEERDAARKSVPSHVFQGEDVEKPKLYD